MVLCPYGPAYGSESDPRPAPEAAERADIPFKEDPVYEQDLLVRVVSATVIGIGLAILIVWVVRRTFFPGAPKLGDGASISLVDFKRIAPRLDVYVLDIEGHRVALVKGGDSWLHVPLEQVAPRSPGESDRTQ